MQQIFPEPLQTLLRKKGLRTDSCHFSLIGVKWQKCNKSMNGGEEVISISGIVKHLDYCRDAGSLPIFFTTGKAKPLFCSQFMNIQVLNKEKSHQSSPQ